MPDTVKCKLLLYPDDSAILVSGKDTVYIEETQSKELHFVRDWLTDESISFGTKRRFLRADKIKVNCAGKEIESKTSVIYLGVSLDKSLSGELTAAKICCEMANKLTLLCLKTRY